MKSIALIILLGLTSFGLVSCNDAEDDDLDVNVTTDSAEIED